MIDLKKKLKNRELTIGSWLNIGNPFSAEIMSQSGFDWIVIDMEHTAITFEQMQQMIQAIELSDSIPLVRVDSCDKTSIKKALDAGAKGIIVPMINSLEDAVKAVNYSYYPPKGKRGVGLSRAQDYGFGFEKYMQWLSDNCVLIVQIENISAIPFLKDIFTLDGIDGYMIGPYDFSASVGCPGDFDNKVVKEGLDEVEKIANSTNISKGYHVVDANPTKVEELIRKGYTFIALGVDQVFLGQACREALKRVRR